VCFETFGWEWGGEGGVEDGGRAYEGEVWSDIWEGEEVRKERSCGLRREWQEGDGETELEGTRGIEEKNLVFVALAPKCISDL